MSFRRSEDGDDLRLIHQYWPSKGTPFTLQFLLNTQPVNLFPLVWLLPSGNLFLQAEFQASIFDYKNSIEYPIDDIPDAVRVYPASAGTAMLPLTPSNNWTSTLVFCGGTDLEANQWTTTWAIVDYAASTSCVRISPDVSLTWEQDDPLQTGRSMGNVRATTAQKTKVYRLTHSSSTFRMVACCISMALGQAQQDTEMRTGRLANLTATTHNTRHGILMPRSHLVRAGLRPVYPLSPGCITLQRPCCPMERCLFQEATPMRIVSGTLCWSLLLTRRRHSPQQCHQPSQQSGLQVLHPVSGRNLLPRLVRSAVWTTLTVATTRPSLIPLACPPKSLVRQPAFTAWT